MFKRPTNLLSPIHFGILLALSLKSRHGYELMQQIEQDSLGKLKPGPGALYGAIKQLRQEGMITELTQTSPDRRRYYQLTSGGRQRLQTELRYFDHALRLADARQAGKLHRELDCV